MKEDPPKGQGQPLQTYSLQRGQRAGPSIQEHLAACCMLVMKKKPRQLCLSARFPPRCMLGSTSENTGAPKSSSIQTILRFKEKLSKKGVLDKRNIWPMRGMQAYMLHLALPSSIAAAV